MHIAKYLVGGVIGASLVLGGVAQASDELAKKYACLACHQIDKKVVGPAYKEVANKYAGADEAKINELADKVIKGGAGVWGPVPMPPNAAVSKEDAVTLVTWILAMADDAGAEGEAETTEDAAKEQEATTEEKKADAK